MTVRVRQLIRVAAGAGGPPPPVATLSFVQQPTDTPVGQLFEPPIRVKVSDGVADVLVLSNNSGDCHINFEYATADSNGVATFTGLSAGTNPSTPEGCTVRVHNVTRPEVPDVISEPFHVTAAGPTNDLLRDLVGYWKMDSIFGPESSATGDLEFEPTNSPGAAEGILGTSRTFNGSTENPQFFVRLAPEEALTTGPVSYTLQAWVYLTNKDSGAFQSIWARYDYLLGTYYPEYIFYYQPGQDRLVFNWYYEPGTEAVVVAANNFGSPPLNTWLLVHIWVDYPVEIGISVNAGPPNVAAVIPAPVARPETWTWWGAMFNRTSGTVVSPFAGRLDELAFWKYRALTPDDRSKLWNNGNGLPFEAFQL